MRSLVGAGDESLWLQALFNQTCMATLGNSRHVRPYVKLRFEMQTGISAKKKVLRYNVFFSAFNGIHMHTINKQEITSFLANIESGCNYFFLQIMDDGLREIFFFLFLALGPVFISYLQMTDIWNQIYKEIL